MSVAERLATPPRTRTSAVAWSAAAALGFLFAIFGAQILVLPTDSAETRLLVSNIAGLVGELAYFAFLRAIHAALRRVAVPAWLMAVAYGVLVVRLVLLVPYFLFGDSLAGPVGATIGVLYFALIGVVAGCVAIAFLPDTPEARTPARIAIVGIVIGLVVTFMVLTGTGLVLIVVSLALALMAAFRKPADPAAA